MPMLVWIFPGRPSKPSRFVELCALMISHIACNANVISLISLITRCVLFRLSIPTSPTQISTHFRVSLPSRRQGEHNNPPTLYLRYFGTHKGQKNSNMFVFHRKHIFAEVRRFPSAWAGKMPTAARRLRLSAAFPTPTRDRALVPFSTFVTSSAVSHSSSFFRFFITNTHDC